MKPKTIALLVVAALFVIVLFQNSDATSVELLFWDLVNIPLFILILSTLILGWLLGWFTHLAYQKGKQKRPAAAPASTEVKDKSKEEGAAKSSDEPKADS